MPATKQAKSAQKALDGLKSQLDELGIDVDIMDVEAVEDAVNLTPAQSKSYRAAVKAVKAFDVAQSEDGMSLTINWVPDEAKMEEGEDDEPADDEAVKSIKASYDRKFRDMERQIKSLTVKAGQAGPRVEVKLPGEREWEARKSRGQTKFKSAQDAYDFGLVLASKIKPDVYGHDRAANATKRLKDRLGQKAQATSPLADGGATIAEQMMSEILTTFDEYGVARNHLRVIPMPKGNATFIEDKNGISASYTGEGATITATDIAWGNVDLRAKKLALRTILSSEIIQDSEIAMAEHVARRFVDATQQKEDEALFLGDGTATYGGINGLGGTFTAKADNYRNVTGAAASTSHTLTNINTLMAKMPARYRQGAAFHCHSAMTSYIFDRLAGSVGGVQWQEVVGYGFVKTFLGVPIIENFVMNSDPTASADTVDVYYANFGEAGFFGDTRSLDIKSSDIPLMASDQTLVVGTRRYDINLWNLGDDNSQSPVVALWQD